MSERTYYVLCEDNCRFESMTKAQILEAIEEAIEQGYVSEPENAVFSRIKEIRANNTAQIWIGTEAQFNAISPAPNIHKGVVRLGYDGKMYFCTNDTTLEAYIPSTRKVNGKALSADITLSATDINNAVSKGMFSFDAQTGTLTITTT